MRLNHQSKDESTHILTNKITRIEYIVQSNTSHDQDSFHYKNVDLSFAQ